MTISEQRDSIVPADHVPGPKQGDWTYSHYAALPDDGKRYEILDGVLYMAPASPGMWHQGSVGSFFYYLYTHVQQANRGKVFVAPFDVELSPRNVVQPDVLVLLNESCEKIKPSRVIGAPDLVVEVLSPSTAKYDWQQKYRAYAQAGIKEYWIADPRRKSIEVLMLESGVYQSVGVFRDR